MSALIYTKDPERPKVTTSTSKIMTAKGTHNFKIEGYFYRKVMGTGKYIASDAFSAGGHLWEIQFYPGGKEKDFSGEIYVSIFVKLISKCEEDLTVSCEYYLLDHNGNRWRKLLNNMNESNNKRVSNNAKESFAKMDMNCMNMDGPFIINAKKLSMGQAHFCKRSELDESQFIKDNCLTIQCSVVVSMELSKKLAQPLPLSADLKLRHEQLLNNKEGSDVTFEVEGEIFYAHKIILSTQSPFFKAQFFGPQKDDKTECIKVEDMQAPVFKALLRFIYCDDIPNLGSNCIGTNMAQHLLAAADRYGIQRMKSLCESRLWENIAIDNVASTLGLAKQYGCFQLKLRCFEFIGLPVNLEAVMQTDGFKNLNESCPSFMSELLKYVVLGRDSSHAKRAKLN